MALNKYYETRNCEGCDTTFEVRRCVRKRFHNHKCALNYQKGKNHPMYGKTHSKEARKKISETHRGVPKFDRRGENNCNWKGGVYKTNKELRRSPAYKRWVLSVLEKDDYTCQICGIRGGKLEADHIKQFSDFPELRLEITNGRCLCKSCHYLITHGKEMEGGVLSWH